MCFADCLLFAAALYSAKMNWIVYMRAIYRIYICIARYRCFFSSHAHFLPVCVVASLSIMIHKFGPIQFTNNIHMCKPRWAQHTNSQQTDNGENATTCIQTHTHALHTHRIDILDAFLFTFS